MPARTAAILAVLLLLTACTRVTPVPPPTEPPPVATEPIPAPPQVKEPAPAAPTVGKIVASVVRNPVPYPGRFGVTFAGEQYGWLSSAKTLRVTTDGGRTWQDLHTFDDLIAHAQALSRADGWVSTDKALYATHDGGKTWAPVTANVLPEFFQFVSRTMGWGNVREQGVDKGMHRTTDGGKTWVPLRSPCNAYTFFRFTSNVTGWAVCGTGGGAGLESRDVHRTDDAGQTWRRVATSGTLADMKGNLPLGSYLRSFFFLDGSHGWIGGVKGGLDVTHDGGATWTSLFSVVDDVDSIQFFTPTHGLMIVGQRYSESSTLAATTDGGKTWAAVYPIAPAQPSEAKQTPDGRLWYAVGDAATPGAVLRRDGEDGAWEQVGALPVKGRERSVRAFSFVDRQHGWAAVAEGQTVVLHRTEDGGRSWQKMSTLPDGQFTQMDFVDAASGYVLNRGRSLLVTHDGGATFSDVPLLPDAFRFVSPSLGWAIANAELMESTDGGATWHVLPRPPGRLFALDLLPNGDAAVMAGDDLMHQKLYVSQDKGKTWTWVDFGDTAIDHFRLAGPGRAWIWDSHQQAYYSSDGFRTWTPVTQRVPSQ